MTNIYSGSAEAYRLLRLTGIVAAFLKLGCTSFGGPIAHLGYLRTEIVEQRRWVNESQYAELVALCQFLPGPTSSQVVFGLGMIRAGWLGAITASACFTLPSTLLMIGFAYGVTSIGNLDHAGWLHGLKLAAVAVVAQAVWGMSNQLCTDRTRKTIALLAAAAILAFPSTLIQLAVLASGALFGWLFYRRTMLNAFTPTEQLSHQSHQSHLAAAMALVVAVALLVVLPIFASFTGNQGIAVFDTFYRAGALVFGGGHVVLPLLRADVVPNGWLSDDQFLAGYGAAQALPGPLFAFAAYAGTAMSQGAYGWINGLLCLFAIFLPGWLIIGGMLPFWPRLRAQNWAQGALAGTNAAVVGILLAALYDPVIVTSVRNHLDVAAVLITFGALVHWKASPLLAVAALAAAGQWIL